MHHKGTRERTCVPDIPRSFPLSSRNSCQHWFGFYSSRFKVRFQKMGLVVEHTAQRLPITVPGSLCQRACIRDGKMALKSQTQWATGALPGTQRLRQALWTENPKDEGPRNHPTPHKESKESRGDPRDRVLGSALIPVHSHLYPYITVCDPQ